MKRLIPFSLLHIIFVGKSSKFRVINRSWEVHYRKNGLVSIDIRFLSTFFSGKYFVFSNDVEWKYNLFMHSIKKRKSNLELKMVSFRLWSSSNYKYGKIRWLLALSPTNESVRYVAKYMSYLLLYFCVIITSQHENFFQLVYPLHHGFWNYYRFM